jgi:hypothetical protein
MAARITSTAVGLTALVAVGAAMTPQPSQASEPTAHHQARASRTASAWTTLAEYGMNERRGHVMHDASPNHLDGVIGRDVGLSGTFYRYPRVPPRTYRPDHPSFVDAPLLNPGASTFRVTWRFRVSPLARPVYAPNFVQKGQGWPKGGMFKLTNHDGRVGCLFRDATRQAAVATGTSFNDGEWHVATCARFVGSDPRIVVSVDGRVLGINHKSIGTISNAWPLAIGGNTRCNGNRGDHPQHCNYWQGDMSWMRIQRQAPADAVVAARRSSPDSG